MPSAPWKALQLILFFYLLKAGQCQRDSDDSIKYSSLEELFPGLAALRTDPPNHHPPPGGQLFSRCCRQAINESYQIINGRVVQVPNMFIDYTPAALNATQFPCGAKYQEDNYEGAPEVRVPYSWCKDNCDGWQKSSGTALTEWVQPFVGFILPSAVFCLHVPRKKQFVLAISEGFFANDFKFFPNKWQAFRKELGILVGSLMKAVLLGLGLRKRTPPNPLPQPTTQRRRSSVANIGNRSLSLGAKFMNVFTSFTALWGFVVVSAISTVLRAALAATIALVNTTFWVAVVFSAASPMILSGLYEASIDRNIIKDMRKSLLASQAWEGLTESQKKEDKEGMRENKIEQDHFHERVHHLYAVLAGNLILPKKQASVSRARTQETTVWEDVNALVDRRRVTIVQGATVTHSSAYAETKATHKLITAKRLKDMLGCQVSFGTAVGAPIVFFLGSFLFSVMSNYSALGENNTSHALAFGMWWMTVPHVAIVSGCLLAGNNPNILEIITIGAVSPREPQLKEKFGVGMLLRPLYNTTYTPVWMMERGRNKQRWIDRIVERYPAQTGTHDSRRKRRAFHLNWVDWIEVLLIAVILVVCPFVLAFLTSYNTPRVGLACRSLTFTLYFSFQSCFCILWAWDFFYQDRIHAQPGKETTISNISWWVYHSLLVFVLTGSGFTAVGGTLLQLVGVYRNCLCAMPIKHWRLKDSFIVVSSNSKTAIRLARIIWLPTGIASIVLLIMTCYGGWWYQRHWRQQFREVVDMLCRKVEGDEVLDVVLEASQEVHTTPQDVRMSGGNGSMLAPPDRNQGVRAGGSHAGWSQGSDDITLSSLNSNSRDVSIPRKPVGEGPRGRQNDS